LLQRFARRAQGALRHLDCSRIKLHQDGANLPGGQTAQAIGRTKGGLNTKLAAVVNSRHSRAADFRKSLDFSEDGIGYGGPPKRTAIALAS